MDPTSPDIAAAQPGDNVATAGRSGFGRRVKLLAVAVAAMLAVAALQVVDPPEASASGGSALACRESNLRGTCQWIQDNTPDLRDSSTNGRSVGNDQISSLYLQPDTRIVLWEHINYTGRCHVLEANSTDHYEMSLVGSGIGVGDDQVSSISFDNDHPCTTFANLSSAHVTEKVYSSVSNLTYTDVGNDSVAGVAAGDEPVAVYSDANFEGSCVTIPPHNWAMLADGYVGASRASSVALGRRCEEDLRVCEHINLGGRCISLTSSKPRMSATDLGNDTASSLYVPPNRSATIYEDDDYKGTPTVVSFFALRRVGRQLEHRVGGWNLGENTSPVGNDELSSIGIG